MSDELERRYRRLLAWYPRAWRQQNAEVVLGTLLDVAEAEGRDHPAAKEQSSMAVHGMSARLTMRAALGLAVAALVAAITAGALNSFVMEVSAAGLSWLSQALLLVVVPVLIATALSAWLRELAIFEAPRTLLVPVLSVVAGVAAAVAVTSWSEGFDAADAGITRPPLERAAGLAALLLAWLGASSVLALFLEPMLRFSSLAAWARWGVSGAIGAAVSPFVGVAFLTATVGVVISITMVVLLAARVRRDADNATRSTETRPLSVTPAPTPTPAQRFVPRTDRLSLGLASALAWVGSGAGLVAVAFALTGSLWFDSGIDSTEAMQLGISGGLIAAVPIVFAIALPFVSRGQVRHAIVPAVLMTLSLLVAATASMLPATTTGQQYPWNILVGAIVLTGAAVGTTAHALARGSRSARLGLALAIAAGYCVTVGLLLVYAMAFVAPVIGVGYAVWGIRRLSRGRDRGPAPRTTEVPAMRS